MNKSLFNLTIIGVIIIILVASLASLSCSSGSQSAAVSSPAVNNAAVKSTPVSTDTIKVGVLASTSGFFASMAQYMVPGAQMAIDKENASGGIMGKKVAMELRDDQGDPGVVAQKCVELRSAGVVGIVGSMTLPVSEAIINWGNVNHFLVSNPGDSGAEARTVNFGKYAFFNCPVYTSYGVIFYQSISKMNDVKSIYFLSAGQAVADNIYGYFWDSMGKNRPDVTNLGSTWVGQQDMDFSNVISTVMSKNPNMIVSGLGGPQWTSFIKQAVQFGLFQKSKLAAIYGLDASTSTPLGKSMPDGLMGVMACPYNLGTPEMDAFQKDYATRAPGQYVNDLTVEFYNATLGLLEAVKAANSTDPEKIIPVWEKLTLDTPLGKAAYDSWDHQLEVPVWWVTTKNVPEYPIIAGSNFVKFQDGIYPTEAQVNAIRAAKK